MISHYCGVDIPDRLYDLARIDDELNVMKLVAGSISNPMTAIEAAAKVLEAKCIVEKIAAAVTNYSIPVDMLYAECKRIVTNTNPGALEAFEYYLAQPVLRLEDQVAAMIASVPTSENENSLQTDRQSVQGTGQARIADNGN